MRDSFFSIHIEMYFIRRIYSATRTPSVKIGFGMAMYFIRNAKKLIITFLQQCFFIYFKNVYLWIDWICTQWVAYIRKMGAIKKNKKIKK